MLRGPDHMAIRVMRSSGRGRFARSVAEEARDAEIPDRLLVLHAVQAGLRERELGGAAEHPAMARVEEYPRRRVDHRAAGVRVEGAGPVDLVVTRIAIVH